MAFFSTIAFVQYNGRYFDIATARKNIDSCRVLVLDGKKMKTFPPSVCLLINLEELNLYDNLFTELPVCLAEMPKLVKINLSTNAFTQFPEILFSMTKLKWLSISGIKMTVLPAGIGNLVNLEYLEMYDACTKF